MPFQNLETLVNLKSLVLPVCIWYLKCKISFLRCMKLSYMSMFVYSFICSILYLILNKVCLPFVCRHFFPSLNGGDVPLIYSPVLFPYSSYNFLEVTLIKVAFTLIWFISRTGSIDNEFT